MDYRKLISFGNSSYVITLPKAWIDKHKLVKGDLVYLEERQSEIALFPTNVQHDIKPKEITIDVTNKTPEHIKREVIAAYINDYNLITMVGSDIKDRISDIREVLHDFIALEIMEQTAGRIVAKSFLNIKDVSLPDTIRRMDIIIRAMFTEIEEPEHVKHEPLYEKDIDVNRLSYLAYRVIRSAIRNPEILRQLGTTHEQLFTDYWVVFYLEKIADEAKRIAKALNTFKLKKSSVKELFDIFSEIVKSYNAIMKAHYLQNRQLAHDVFDALRDRIKRCDEIMFEQKAQGAPLIIEKLKSLQTHVRAIALLVQRYESPLSDS